MKNISTFNRLSIALFILTVLNFGGFGYLSILSVFIPYWRITFLIIMSLLLILSCYQIYKTKQRGIAFNLVTAINIIFGFLMLNRDGVNWLNDTFGKYKDGNTLTIIYGISGICLVIAIIHYFFKKFENSKN